MLKIYDLTEDVKKKNKSNLKNTLKKRYKEDIAEIAITEVPEQYEMDCDYLITVKTVHPDFSLTGSPLFALIHETESIMDEAGAMAEIHTYMNKNCPF